MSERSRRRLSFPADEVNSSSTQVCALCTQHHSHISKVAEWQNAKAQDEVFKYGITRDDIVCRCCRDDIRKMLGRPDHIPRWEKRKIDVKCCVKGCENISFVHNKTIQHDTILQVFDEVGLQTKEDTVPFPTPFCSHHYHTVYNATKSPQTNCRTCGICLKRVQSRRCPN